MYAVMMLGIRGRWHRFLLIVAVFIMANPSAVRAGASVAPPESPTPGHIAALRQAVSMTQSEFANALGVDKMTVWRWEKGETKPTRESVKAIERLRRTHARRGVVVGDT